jgi:hypothetical protein
MPLRRQRKCRHCGQLYQPDPRSGARQRYCSQPACRKASKADSQARWLASPKGRGYFRGRANVQRVKTWRKANPGYWRRARKPPGVLQDAPSALQDSCPPQALVPPEDTTTLTDGALQDVMRTQAFALTGLVAQLTGSPLQENIAFTLRRLILLGQQIQGPDSRRQRHAPDQTSALPGTVAAGAAPVQLDRPSPGPRQAHLPLFD